MRRFIRKSISTLLQGINLFQHTPPPFPISSRLSYEPDEYFIALSKDVSDVHKSDLRRDEPSEIRLCLLYGANCKKPHQVAVKVHSGFEGRCWPIDLEVDEYVDRPQITNGGVVRVNEGYHEIRPVKTNHAYTVISSEGVMVPLLVNKFLLRRESMSSYDEREGEGIQRAPAFGLEFSAGNLLIARTDASGAVVDVSIELTAMICELLPFSELVLLARSDDHSWQIVDYELKRRLLIVLQRFISREHALHLLCILNHVEGAVAGLAALETILFLETRHTPLDYNCLDLLLPSTQESMERVVRFFRRIGFTGLEIEKISPSSDPSQQSHRTAAALGQGPANSPHFPCGVRLFASRGGPITSLVEASATHLMNIVSPDGVYCFYNDLTLNGRGIASSEADKVDCLVFDEDNRNWGPLCKMYCPQLRRKTLGDTATLIHRWRVPVGSAYDHTNGAGITYYTLETSNVEIHSYPNYTAGLA
ncbi:hypothetical protein BKA70DRAFT_1241627 [Coprinopsis sp. MPI-PUGE-AT-0042]|nr:hypothetical protein BKA70DRAFT_1241627 [Coprinopsis sp. MPI-PUGE-AT-0042]